MKLNKTILITFLLFAAGVVLLTLALEEAQATTITVDDSGGEDYTKIQDAIDNATEGDTIRVFEGRYKENVLADKEVNLIGNSSENTTIDGNWKGDAVKITADFVNVSGFTLTAPNYAGLRTESHYNQFFENNCTKSRRGIRVVSSNENIIRDNNCSENNIVGIFLESASGNVLTGNICWNNAAGGVYLMESSNSNVISNNTCSDHRDYGIYLTSSCEYNTIVNNTCFTNNIGIYLHKYAGRNTLSNNSCTKNKECGISLTYASHNNTIVNNTCSSNDEQGIYLTSSRNNTLMNNACSGNDFGICLESSSDDNDILGNRCQNNRGSGGIIIDRSYNNNLINNSCFNQNTRGIFLIYTYGNTLANNSCRENDYGIAFSDSSDNIVSNNALLSNDHGTFLSSSNFNTFQNNEISHNNYYGINLFDADNDNYFFHNTISQNKEYGVFLYNSEENTFLNNTISSNKVGILLSSDSEETGCKNTAAQYNLIYNNRQYGISALNNQGYTINATWNWWGDDSGPFHSSLNPSGKGDNVTLYVESDPWIGGPVAFIDSVAPDPALDTKEITFMGHGAPSNNIALYVWSSSRDGELYNGTNATFSSETLSLGTHTISFRIMNDDGVWSSLITEDLIVHRRPTAVIISISSELVPEGSPVRFVGKGMDDGTVQQFQWVSDKDGVFGLQGNVSVSNLSAESHNISLRVKDNYGVWSNWTNWSEQITINRKPLVTMELLFPNPALDSESVSFVANGMDGDGFIQFYLWNSSIEGELYNGSEDRFSTSELSLGEHTITLVVMDNDYAWSDPVTTNLVVTKKPVATIESISPNPVLVGETVFFQGAGTDDGTIVQYVWFSDIDGEIYNGTEEEFNLSDLSPGIHTITLRVQDNNVVWSKPVETPFHVRKPPYATIYAPTNRFVIEGETVNFTGDGTDDGVVVSYSWDFDDQNGISEDAIGKNVSHRYSSHGKYNVTFTVTDDDGLVGMRSLRVDVAKLLNSTTDSKGDVRDYNSNKVGGHNDIDVENVKLFLIGDTILFEMNVCGKIQTTQSYTPFSFSTIYYFYIYNDQGDDIFDPDDADFKVFYTVGQSGIQDKNDEIIKGNLDYVIEGFVLQIVAPLELLGGTADFKFNFAAAEFESVVRESGFIDIRDVEMNDDGVSNGSATNDEDVGFLPGFEAGVVVASAVMAVPVVWWKRNREKTNNIIHLFAPIITYPLMMRRKVKKKKTPLASKQLPEGDTSEMKNGICPP